MFIKFMLRKNTSNSFLSRLFSTLNKEWMIVLWLHSYIAVVTLNMFSIQIAQLGIIQQLILYGIVLSDIFTNGTNMSSGNECVDLDVL